MLNPSLDQSYSFDDLFIRRQEISALEQERLKLALIKKLFDEQRILDFKKNTDNTSNPTGLTEQGIYYFLVTFGLIEQCAGSFVFGASLFGLIPGISKFSLIAISLVYTLLDSLLFYAFEVTFLKEALGIESLNSELKGMLEIFKEQLYYVELLNIHIEALKKSPDFNHELLNILEKINKDMIEKCHIMQDQPISASRQFVQYGVLSFGVLANVAESYFLAHSFLILLTPTLAFTGMGYLLIAITIIANLGFFYAMGASSVVKIMHPDLDDLKALKRDINNFNSVISTPKTV